ncbi:class I adenylate-forming enzyme family protein [Bailinhaonella thermotolerans]|uniref:Long-chain fatty acid--CoA ligase n=1 Tax=Bailinhaonella thermotolerans TaxID=1070861 RepID=A0A3A4B5H2_9ACTN|nr:fatty acid--CoA ligase family protein [Bailinhaonella thermotolerans]RJL32662.1 long-chain fatty acid--CoA ligase [Bailinhaonella thermotolerans]
MDLFPHALLAALRDDPRRPAFEHGDRVVSRGEVLELTARIARGLREAGLGPGSALAVRTGVTPEAFAAHLAAHTLGCAVVALRPGFPAARLPHVFRSGIGALLLDPASAMPDVLAAAGPVPLLALGPYGGARDLLAGPGGGEITVTARRDDAAMVMFTSGSTGRPKGCATTYGALTAHWAWQPRTWSPLAAEFAASFGRYLLTGPFASTVIMEFLAPCLLGGGTAVIPVDDDGPLLPYAIERHRISGAVTTVPGLRRMLDRLRERSADLGSLRALVVVGSPLSPARLRSAVDLLGPVVYQGYGLTEAGSIAMLTPGDIARGPDRVLSSVGRPHRGVEVTVRDEADRELPPGRLGEVHVRSPYLMAGYRGDPETTRAVLRDGRLRTGDLGFLDEDGYLHLAGRVREVIRVNGSAVHAGPIERALSVHPDVAEAYVAGAADARTGEAVHAFVVPAPGRVPDPEALTDLVRAGLGPASAPATITPVSAVPLTPSGKPDKRALLHLLTP